MINQSNIFDLQDLIFNELIGDVMLAVIVGLIVIWYITAKFNINYKIAILLGLLWLMVVFAGNTGLISIWVFVVLFIGTLFYYGISKIIRRG